MEKILLAKSMTKKENRFGAKILLANYNYRSLIFFSSPPTEDEKNEENPTIFHGEKTFFVKLFH